ncbi:hypothetical protein SeLEV6574_g03262 [Synchytrium endobioticum]|nr:hypothetical protein SeLEV6574_g03262 [Synchytrium endobioticum]
MFSEPEGANERRLKAQQELLYYERLQKEERERAKREEKQRDLELRIMAEAVWPFGKTRKLSPGSRYPVEIVEHRQREAQKRQEYAKQIMKQMSENEEFRKSAHKIDTANGAGEWLKPSIESLVDGRPARLGRTRPSDNSGETRVDVITGQVLPRLDPVQYRRKMRWHRDTFHVPGGEARPLVETYLQPEHRQYFQPMMHAHLLSLRSERAPTNSLPVGNSHTSIAADVYAPRVVTDVVPRGQPLVADPLRHELGCMTFQRPGASVLPALWRKHDKSIDIGHRNCAVKEPGTRCQRREAAPWKPTSTLSHVEQTPRARSSGLSRLKKGGTGAAS